VQVECGARQGVSDERVNLGAFDDANQRPGHRRLLSHLRERSHGEPRIGFPIRMPHALPDFQSHREHAAANLSRGRSIVVDRDPLDGRRDRDVKRLNDEDRCYEGAE